MIDREKLRATLEAAAEAISVLADQVIAAKVPAMLPPQLRPLVPLMAGRLQTRSMMSDAATRLSDELADDEIRTLCWLIGMRLAEIAQPVTYEVTPDGVRGTIIRAAAPSDELVSATLAHLRNILSA